MKLPVILTLLDNIRQVDNNSWKAPCPAHNDVNPSLSVSRGEKQEAILFCHAGCDYNSILKALVSRLKTFETEYIYRNSNEFIIGKVCRTYDDNGNKKFFQQVPIKPYKTIDRITWKNGSSTELKQTIYRLPEILRAIDNSKPIFIVEGEKDADRIREEGYAATCNPQGAGKWTIHHSDFLIGASRVFIIADNDAPGLKHAWAIHDSLDVKKVTVHISPFGKDITEHLDSGHSFKELERLEPPPVSHPRIVSGSSFIFDTPAEVPAIWGYNGKVVMWAKGQGCMLVAPQGVGKTTLASLLLEARLGLTDSVLDIPVLPSDKNSLYMAMDRPDQIANAMRRRFERYGRSNDKLLEKLKIWPGPPEHDYARHPHALAELAISEGADTIFIDSLKDAIIGLSKEEPAQGWNNAVQNCLLNGIQICILNHPVKNKNTGTEFIKPVTLDDVYGSQWLTSGLGSVISLWGERNSSFAELYHMKQPAIPIDPLTIMRNGRTGEMQAIGNQLEWTWAFMEGPKTIAELAAKMFAGEKSSANYQKARRVIEDLEHRGIIIKHSKTIGGQGKPADRYILREPE